VTHPPQFALTGVVDGVVWREEVTSTSTYLSQNLSGGSQAVLSWNQTGGRGRLGRDWVSPAGGSLAMSVALWPEVVPGELSAEWLGRVSLIAGATLADAIRPHLNEPVRLKWPNDVLVSGKKVAGILGEIPTQGLVVVGVGINVSLTRDQLPTEHSTSLGLHGFQIASLEKVITTFLQSFCGALEQSRQGLSGERHAWLSEQLETLGSRVRVEYPSGEAREGIARSLDYSGRLLVDFDGSSAPKLVDSADVWHLRPAHSI